MGRNKIKKSLKKKKLSVTIEFDNKQRFYEFGIKNKSGLINELLKEYFEDIEKAEVYNG